jgi:hypothetical protein
MGRDRSRLLEFLGGRGLSYHELSRPRIAIVSGYLDLAGGRTRATGADGTTQAAQLFYPLKTPENFLKLLKMLGKSVECRVSSVAGPEKL